MSSAAPGGGGTDPSAFDPDFSLPPRPTAPTRPPRGRKLVEALRWGRSLLITAVCGFFALPFVAVGCLPTKFGAQTAGGETTYSGYTMAFGLQPGRNAEHLVPSDQALPDQIGLQPLILVALILLVGLLVATFAISDPTLRRLVTGAGALIVLGLVLLGTHIARGAVTELVASQVTQPLSEGRTPADFVSTGNGYGFTIIALAVLALFEGIWGAVGILRARSAARRAATGGAQPPPAGAP